MCTLGSGEPMRDISSRVHINASAHAYRSAPTSALAISPVVGCVELTGNGDGASSNIVAESVTTAATASAVSRCCVLDIARQGVPASRAIKAQS